MCRKICLVLLSIWIIPQLNWRIYLDMFPEIREVAKCESGISSQALNKVDTDGLPAKGLLQFKDNTFYSWAKLAKIENAFIWNPMQQIILYRWAKDNNLLRHFGCYNQLKKDSVFNSLY